MTNRRSGKSSTTQAITIPDLDKTLHTKAKTAAAAAEITLKEWIKQAIREKLNNDR